MKEIRRITFTGKNLNDVFNLPCVLSIEKKNNEPRLVLNTHHLDYILSGCVAFPNDELVEYDNGLWRCLHKPVEEEKLMKMTMDEANKNLNRQDMGRWVELHNKTARVFHLGKDKIKQVPPQGWWY
jgi:hypothetical protein